jgi:hypothetical protein
MLPNPGEPNNDIGLFGGDMYLNDYGVETRIYYQAMEDPTRLVVEFVNLHHCCGYNIPRTFEVILYSTGDIQSQYDSLNSTSSDYVGIENAGGTDGLGYGVSLADQLAIRYYYPTGVFLFPPSQQGYGEPGETSEYTLMLTNHTGGTDSFNLSVVPGNAWVTNLSVLQVGPIEDGERLMRPLKSFGSPVLDLCSPKPFVAHQGTFDASFRHGWWYYVRSCDVAALNDDIIDIMAEYGKRIVSPITSVALWQMGGAVARVGANETAFNGRKAGFTFNINGNSVSAGGFEAEREWARAYWSALGPYHTSAYVNFLMEEGQDRIRQAYGAEKYDRLKALKRKYDPTNFFRLNQNIAPD